MIRYIIRRLLFSIPVLIVASILVFYVVKISSNPNAICAGNARLTAADCAKIKRQLGLDKSGFSQYTSWLSHWVRGDWGISIFTFISVKHDIFTALGNTIILGMVGVGFSLIIGMGIGIVSAVRQYSWFDNLATGGAFLGLSMPNFWFAYLLQICRRIVGAEQARVRLPAKTCQRTEASQEHRNFQPPQRRHRLRNSSSGPCRCKGRRPDRSR